MKESYGEGIAIHAGTESCGDTRKGALKRRQGYVRAGYTAAKVVSSGAPTLEGEAEGHTGRVANARRGRARAVGPCAHTESPCTGTGRSQSCPRRMEPRDAACAPPAGPRPLRRLLAAIPARRVPRHTRAVTSSARSSKIDMGTLTLRRFTRKSQAFEDALDDGVFRRRFKPDALPPLPRGAAPGRAARRRRRSA